MSSLRNAINRRAHKERAQPNARKRFGLLEKHKDYALRAKAFHKKEETLRKLEEKAAFRNPDEFYFKMIKTQTVDGIHRPENEAKQYSHEELMLMKTQDVGYLLQKIQSEKNKIEKLSSALHSVGNQPQNKHIYFADDREEAREILLRSSAMAKPPVFGDVPKHIDRKAASSYRELEARNKGYMTYRDCMQTWPCNKNFRRKVGSTNFGKMNLFGPQVNRYINGEQNVSAEKVLELHSFKPLCYTYDKENLK